MPTSPGAAFNSGGGAAGGISATDPTTPVATATTPAVRVDQDADEGTYLLSFRPATYNTQEGTDPPIGGFNFVFVPARDFGGNGTRLDRPFAMGYNFGTAGGGTASGGDGITAELSTEATFGITFEDFYNLNGTSARQFEFYLATTPAGDDGTGQHRAFMVVSQYDTLASDTPPQSGVFFRVEGAVGGFSITHGYDNAGTLSTRTSDTAGTVTVTAAHNIVTGTTKNVRWIVGGVYGARTGVTIGSVSGTGAGSTVAFSGGSGDNLPAQTSAIEFYDSDTIILGGGSLNNGLDSIMEFSAGAGILFANNSRSLKAKNSSGTPRDLLSTNSSNFMFIGDGGWPTIQVEGYLRAYYGMATLYSTDAAITDANFTGNGSSTPSNGSMAITLNGGTTKLWVRTGGTWKSVTLS